MHRRAFIVAVLCCVACGDQRVRTQPEPSPNAPEGESLESPPPSDPPLGEHDLVAIHSTATPGQSSDVLVIRDDGTCTESETSASATYGRAPSSPRTRDARLSTEQFEELRTLLADPSLSGMPTDSRDLAAGGYLPDRDVYLRTPSGVVRVQYTKLSPGPPDPLRPLERLFYQLRSQYFPG